MNGDLMNAESNYKNDSLIDRLLKISLVDGALSLDDVVGETNTILIAVSYIFIKSFIFRLIIICNNFYLF